MMLRTPEAQLSLANDVSFRVALNAIKLRKLRGLSQAAVAGAMGTSQPEVARIESGDDNITLATLRKLVDALRGRLVLAIQPAEMHMPSLPEWWEAPMFASQCVWQPAALGLTRSTQVPRHSSRLGREVAVEVAGEFVANRAIKST
jgi:transcriptional regulator with XRE-family HTH domain